MRINDAVSRKTIEEITNEFNENKYHPIDGRLIKIADDLSAFVEVRLALKNGFTSQHLKDGEDTLSQKYKDHQVAGINIGKLFEEVRDLTEQKDKGERVRPS